jgi:hypothetical protein
MSTLKADILVTPQDILASVVTQGTDLGARATSGDSRYFRYMKIGAAATVPGQVYQGPAQDSTNLNPSGGLGLSANAAIGATSVTISTAVTVAADVLVGGFMTVAVTPGQGYTYKINGNTAVTGAAGMVVTLEDPLQIALTSAASKVCLYKNPYHLYGFVLRLDSGGRTMLLSSNWNRNLWNGSWILTRRNTGITSSCYCGNIDISVGIGNLRHGRV